MVEGNQVVTLIYAECSEATGVEGGISGPHAFRDHKAAYAHLTDHVGGRIRDSCQLDFVEAFQEDLEDAGLDVTEPGFRIPELFFEQLELDRKIAICDWYYDLVDEQDGGEAFYRVCLNTLDS